MTQNNHHFRKLCFTGLHRAGENSTAHRADFNFVDMFSWPSTAWLKKRLLRVDVQKVDSDSCFHILIIGAIQSALVLYLFIINCDMHIQTKIFVLQLMVSISRVESKFEKGHRRIFLLCWGINLVPNELEVRKPLSPSSYLGSPEKRLRS